MKTSILTICISIFSLALFAQSPQNTNNTIKAVDISEGKTEVKKESEEYKIKKEQWNNIFKE